MDSRRDGPATRASLPHLDDLVKRTEGPQPLRRLFHAFCGTVVAIALTWLELSRGAALWILGVILALLMAGDALRLRVPEANAFFFRAFGNMASPREATEPVSSTWYALGLLVSIALFSRDAAVSGVLILAWADPAASYGGRRWGTRRFLGGSVEGTGIFVLVAFAVLLARHSLVVAGVTAMAVAIVERLSWRLDDNLTVPVSTAGLVTLLEYV